jgi:hypothetical protein
MIFIISKKNYLYFNNIVKIIQFIYIENLIIKNIIKYLYLLNYIKYRFNINKQKYKYWVNSIISLFSPIYITVGSQVQEARDALQVVWDIYNKVSNIK